MPIAHICPHCGVNLRGVVSQWDDQYQLAVIVCPGCSHGAVRRRHPLQRAARTIRRMDWAIGLIVVNVGLLITTMFFTVGACGGFAAETMYTTMDDFVAMLRDEPAPYIAVLGILPLAIGAVLTIGLGHWRRWRAWLAFFGLAAACLATVPLAYLAMEAIEPVRVLPARQPSAPMIVSPRMTAQINDAMAELNRQAVILDATSPSEIDVDTATATEVTNMPMQVIVDGQVLAVPSIAPVPPVPDFPERFVAGSLLWSPSRFSLVSGGLLCVIVPLSLLGIPVGLGVRKILLWMERSARAAHTRRLRSVR